MIIAHTVNHLSKDIRFYLDSASKVHMYYNRLLLSTYNKENSPLVCTTNYIQLVVFGKGTVTLDALVNGKPEVVNFCNILYISELEYNLLSIDTIEKVSYLILAKK